MGCPCKKNGGGAGKKVTITQPKATPQPTSSPTSPSSPLRPSSPNK